MLKRTIGILTLFILTSCANYKLNIAKDIENEPITAENGDIVHTMYLIGDSGNAKAKKDSLPALVVLERHLLAAGENSSVVFLGDNIYPNGLAPKREKEEHKKDLIRLDAQLDILKNYKGKPYFIAGNHDWAKWGLDGVQRQEKYVEKVLDKGDTFVPDAGCGDPEEIEINDNLVILAIDSQWFLQDWEGETEINDGCEVKSRTTFMKWFEEALKSNRNNNVVIVMHHPLYSNGPHGGGTTLKQHIFPLTQLYDNLYIPLPGVGTIGAFLRSVTGLKQDLSHVNYKEMKRGLLAGANKNGNFIFASGHDHGLQYFEKNGHSFIVSGAGSKREPTSMKNGALFTYGQYGFTQLDFYGDGSVNMKCWAAYTNKTGEVVFERKIKGPLPSAGAEVPNSFPEFE
ncbi:MAG: metallophosphoesterase, partial [Bacteroidota bacterium]